MRDIFVFMFLLASIGLSFRKPWHGVLALAVLSYMNPHAFAWGFMTRFPVYFALFIAVAMAVVIRGRDRQPIPKDWRIVLFCMLWFYFFLTTLVALVPQYAWPKLTEVSKIYLPFVFTLILINTREKLHYLIVTIALSIGLVAIKGGIFALGTGFSYRVWGPAGTQFGGNNEFAVATVMIIPLLVLWMRTTKFRLVRLAMMVAVPLCMASAISSHSRGGFLTLGVTSLLLILDSKRKWLAAPLMVVGVFVAINMLPDEWFARMETIETYEEDESAQGRLEVWRDGFNYALKHPLTGSGFNGWLWVSQRDWHSSYVEVMAEHGLIAFAMWMSLLFGTIISLTRLARQTRYIPGLEWVGVYSKMIRASLVAYAVGTIFLGLSYWDIFYHLVFVSVLVKKFALQELEVARRRPTLADSPRGAVAT